MNKSFPHHESDCHHYIFEGLNFTIEEINALLLSIQEKVNRGEIKDGLSAYDIAVKNGYKGTEEEWLLSLKGDKGEPLRYQDLTPEQIEELQLPAILAAKRADEAIKTLVFETETKTDKVIKDAQKVVEASDKVVQETKANTQKLISDTQKKTDNLISETQKETSKAIAQVNLASEVAIENSKMQWYPNVNEEGDLSWQRSKQENPPEPVNIKGPKGNDGLSGSLEEVNIVVVEDLSGGAGEPGKSYVLGASVGPELEKLLKRNTLSIEYDEETGDFYSVTDVDDSVVQDVGMDANGDLYANFNYDV